MKGQDRLRRVGRLLVVQLIIALSGVALWTSIGWAQEENPAAGLALAGVAIAIGVVFFAAFYIYAAVCLQIIARKTNTPDGWLAWIPIANFILMLNIAHRPVWWILLLLVPIVNIVIGVIVWMEIAKARRKPQWWGVMTIVPVMNLIAPGYLAFSE